MIPLEEFQKIDLRVGKILEVERIAGSDKLLKLDVDLGEELGKRQLIAGIGKVYEPESIRGRQIVIVSNLEPKMMMGLESQGMLLAADSSEGPVLLTPAKDVLPGTKIK